MNCSYAVASSWVLYPIPTGKCVRSGDNSFLAECNGDNNRHIKIYTDANCTGDGVSIGGATYHNCPNPSCNYFHGCSAGIVNAMVLDVCQVSASGNHSIKYTSCSGETGSQSVEVKFYMDTTECSGSGYPMTAGDWGWNESCTVCSVTESPTKSPTSGDNDEVTKSPTSEPQDSKAPSSGLVVLGLIAAVTVAVSML